MANMPFEDSVFFLPLYAAAKEGEEYNPKDDRKDNSSSRRWYKKQLDKIRGRDNRERKQVSVEQFMQEIGNNG